MVFFTKLFKSYEITISFPFTKLLDSPRFRLFSKFLLIKLLHPLNVQMSVFFQ